MKLAKLKENIIFDSKFHKGGKVEITIEDELSLLNEKNDTFTFFVKKLEGTGASAIDLNKDEFNWIK